MARQDDARQRAAQTKLARSRQQLLEAARFLFDTHGWHETRMEDVAAAAGVSAATAYNHFPSKQTLLGRVYRPLSMELKEQALEAILRRDEPLQAVKDHVQRLCRVLRDNRPLTIALFTAIHEQTMATQSKIARADNDVRSMVDLGAPLEQLISYGQDTNVFPRHRPTLMHAGAYHTNALLMWVVIEPNENRIQQDVEVVLSQLLPVLTDAGKHMNDRYYPDS